jgi:TatD DNase family protein
MVKRMPEVLANMKKSKVSHALCVAVSLADASRALALAEKHSFLYATVGVHPGRKDSPEPDVETLVSLAKHPKVVAIGETGLDYFHVKKDREWQHERFRVQIRAARACNKPLIIHAREAADDVIRIMQEEGAGTDKGGPGGVMHCFNETLPIAKAAMEMGFYISFSGVVTFPNAKELQKVACAIPLERMMIETDSPYLAPVPYRGKTNEPAYVALIGEFMAKLKGVPLARLAGETSKNFFTLFDIANESATGIPSGQP